MRSRDRFLLTLLAPGAIALLTAVSVSAQAHSHARIIRLSFVEGDVTVLRPDVRVWAEAPVNTPLQEGFKLSTGENSYAEIQFENGGTIRLGTPSTSSREVPLRPHQPRRADQTLVAPAAP